MFYLQIFLPAGLVLLLFSFGHTLVEADYSGVYFEEQLEELVEAEKRSSVKRVRIGFRRCAG